MAKLDKEHIKNLSSLCRIQLSDEEVVHFHEDISKILDYVEQLSQVDLTHLTPHSHIEEQGTDLLREDKVCDLLPRDLFLKNSQKHIGGMIAVPPVMKSI